MRIAVMSDTHLSHVTDEFKAVCSRYCDNADLVIHLGDWNRGPILDYLGNYPLEAVAGNMDDHVIRSSLPVKKTLRVDGYRIGIIHGYGSAHGMRERLYNEFSDVDAILFGHTHEALCIRENGVLWLNPGSVFSGRGQVTGSLGILHTGEGLEGEIIVL